MQDEKISRINNERVLGKLLICYLAYGFLSNIIIGTRFAWWNSYADEIFVITFGILVITYTFSIVFPMQKMAWFQLSCLFVLVSATNYELSQKAKTTPGVFDPHDFQMYATGAIIATVVFYAIELSLKLKVYKENL